MKTFGHHHFLDPVRAVSQTCDPVQTTGVENSTENKELQVSYFSLAFPTDLAYIVTLACQAGLEEGDSLLTVKC